MTDQSAARDFAGRTALPPGAAADIGAAVAEASAAPVWFLPSHRARFITLSAPLVDNGHTAR